MASLHSFQKVKNEPNCQNGSRIGSVHDRPATPGSAGRNVVSIAIKSLSVNASGFDIYSKESTSNPTALLVLEVPPEQVNAPSSVSATATSATSVNLTWNDNSSNETSFKIERKEGSSGNWSLIHSTAANVTSYTDNTVTGDSTYDYRVRASDGTLYSQYSDEASVTTSSGLTLSISGASSIDEGSTYTLSLSATGQAASTITGWTIDWGDGTSPQTVSGTPSTVTHVFTDGNANRTITATATDGDDTFEAGSASVTVNNVAPVLDVQGDDEINEGQPYTLSLDSTDVGDDEITSWTIDWGDGSQPYVYSYGSGSIEHTFAGTASDYDIEVTATDEDGTYDADVLTVIRRPASVTDLTLTGSTSGILLDWSDNAESDLAGYNVYRSDSFGGTYTKLNTSGLITTSTYNDANAPQHAYSFYRTTAVDSNGNESSNSSSGSGAGMGSAYRPPTYQLPASGGLVYEWTGDDPVDEVLYDASRSGSISQLTRQMENRNNSYTLSLDDLPVHSGIRVVFGALASNIDPLPDQDQLTLNVNGETFTKDIPRPYISDTVGLDSLNLPHTDDSVTITIGGSNFESGTPAMNAWYALGLNVFLLPPVTAQLSLKTTGKIVEAPENEIYDAEKTAAGGIDDLGPLPDGDGRAAHPGKAFTNTLMAIGTVNEPVPGNTEFRWQRSVQLQAWNITKVDDDWFILPRDKVEIPNPHPDTGGDIYNDATPSDDDKVYIYDDSAETVEPRDNGARVGDYIKTEKQFVYELQAKIDGEWKTLDTLKVRHLILLKRVANDSGSVAGDWDDEVNIVEVGEVDCTTDEEEIRGIVGEGGDVFFQPGTQ